MGSKKLSSGYNNTPEHNIAILGALGVGKSALTVKFITRRFIMEYDPTLEDTYVKPEQIDGQDMFLKIMDTYDKEGKDADRYLKWASAFIVVYSITSRCSFHRARDYLQNISDFQKTSNKNIPVALVGNKMDLERYRMVNKAEGIELAAQFECIFHETTAAEDYQSIENVFLSLVREISRTKDRQVPLLPLFISEDNGRTSLKRSKSPKTAEIKEKKDDREPKEGSKTLPRRTVSNFRFFNKSFKIFN